MINDLPDHLQDVESSLFADDSCIFKSGNSIDIIPKPLQKNLNKIADWCNLWGGEAWPYNTVNFVTVFCLV